jgi:hypothetical protein
MKIFEAEKNIKSALLDNKVRCDVNYLLKEEVDTKKLAQACIGNACAFAAINDKQINITDDVMPISSILVTDIWNANGDVFTAEEIVRAEQTPQFKPINWMHRGSEDSENENIGVMVNATLIHGDLPTIDFINDEDKTKYINSKANTLSGSVHIKQDGLIWSQYFPTYAEKIKKGIEKENLYVSMECFFEDFGYCLRKNEDDTNPIFVDRTEATAHMSEDLRQYGGRGVTKHKGSQYQIGRWLKNIIFSGQGIVVEPANKRKGKILSVIIKNNTKAEVDPNFDQSASNPPTAPVQEPGAILNPAEMNSQEAPVETVQNYKPTTYEAPSDGLLFYSAKEAEKVGEIELGCTGSHLYQEDRHGDNPLLYARLLGDPTDLENQMKVAQYRPCANEQELRFVLEDMAKKGMQLRRMGRLLDQQNTSVQPSAPGGGGNVPSGTPITAPTSNTTTQNTQQQSAPSGGGGQATRPSASKIHTDLDNNNEEVYPINGDNIMPEVSEQELEKTISSATDLIEKLQAENKEYEAAIIEATEHIEKLNQTVSDYEAFASSVEAIADAASAAKLGEERVSEMKGLLGEDFGMTKSELSKLDDAAYAALKSSVAKITSAIDAAAEEMEKTKAATAALSAAKKPKTNTLVVSETTSVKTNPVESLIGFAMGKKR